MAAIGGLVERFMLRRLAGQRAGAGPGDARHLLHGGRPLPHGSGPAIRSRCRRPLCCAASCAFGGIAFPIYRLAIIVIAVVVAAGLWLMLERTRLGAMIRAGVDDPRRWRGWSASASRGSSRSCFCLGAGLAGFAGMIGAPILSVYPGPRRRHAAAGARRGDPRRHRQPAGALRRQLHRRRFSIISARRSCPSSPTSCCSCRWCWCWCCGRRDFFGAAGAMSARGGHRLSLVAAGERCRFWVRGTYYVNIASQILIYAVFALGLNVLVGYARARLARPCRALRRVRAMPAAICSRRARASRRASPARSSSQRPAPRSSPVLALRADRHRLRHDHAGARARSSGASPIAGSASPTATTASA